MSFVTVKKIQFFRKRGAFLEELPKENNKVKLSALTAISKNVILILLQCVAGDLYCSCSLILLSYPVWLRIICFTAYLHGNLCTSMIISLWNYKYTIKTAFCVASAHLV